MADSDFRWGEVTYTLREFLDNFSLPQIVKVTAGHYGYSEVESLAAGQVVRIHRQARQLRVIAEDRHGRRLSIPANRKGLAMFDVISGSGNQEIGQDIVDILQTYTLPLRAQFSREINLRSRDRQGVQKFGELTLLETYEETYLQGNSFDGDTLVETVLVIPLYLNLRVVVAEGLLRSAESDWTSLCQALTDIATTNVRFDCEIGNEDVSLYTKTSVEEHNNIYDYIEPTRILKVYAVRDPMSSEVLEVAKSYAPLPPNPEETKSKKKEKKKEEKKIPPPVPTKPRSYSGRAGIPLPGMASQLVTGQLADKPPRHKSPVVQQQPAGDQSTADSYQTLSFDPSETCYQGLYTEGEKFLWELTISRASSAPVSPRQKEGHPVVPSRKPLPPPPAGAVPTAVVFASPAVVQTSTREEESRRNVAEEGPAQGARPAAAVPSITAGGHFSTTSEPVGVFIETFNDIPKDLRTLNIPQIADCLRLLKLDKYIPSFEENMVDGDLLMDLDKGIMRTDLNMSPLDCIKLLKFRDEGWRPRDQ